MDMSGMSGMSTPSSPSTPTSSMSMSTPIMPSSTSSSSMSAMPMSNGTMGIQNMMMLFFTASNTPLYASSWTPDTAGQYAGTCIFLIVLSTVFRALIALRCNFLSLLDWTTQTRATSMLRSDSDEKGAVAGSLRPAQRPWKINEAILRALLDTILAGVSYLLMLAVMTMNVGYLLSVLGGTFLGSLVVGGWTGPTAH